MPALSPTMTEGTITKWYKQEGDSIQPGEVLCDIETDKAVVSFELEEDAVLAKILKKEMTQGIPIGTAIAVTVDEDEDWRTAHVDLPAEMDPPAAVIQEDAPRPTVDANVSAPQRMGSVKMGPAARSLLEVYQIIATQIKATGARGLLTKSDVLQYISQHGLTRQPFVAAPRSAAPSAAATAAPSATAAAAAAPLPKTLGDATGAYTDVALSDAKRTLAKQVADSKRFVPHFYSRVRCNVSAAQRLAHLHGLSLSSVVVAAAAAALRQSPAAINSNDTQRVDVALTTAAGTSLVRNAHEIGLRKIDALTQAAGATLEEAQAATFTIADLSSASGVTEVTAVLPPRQSAILAVGSAQPDTQWQPDAVQPAPLQLAVTLSSDASLVDALEAAHFLRAFRANLERPELLLLPGSADTGLARWTSTLEEIGGGWFADETGSAATAAATDDVLQLGLDA